MKQTDVFDKLNNTIGNHMEGKATDQDLIDMVYEVDKYLLENPHPHDLIQDAKRECKLCGGLGWYYETSGNTTKNYKCNCSTTKTI